MAQQSFKNHRRLLPAFHFVATPLILTLLVLTIINLVQAVGGNKLQAVILLLLVIALALVHLNSRMMPLKAQDRIIRAEENFRHYVLTGKPLYPNLRLRQIIALRFASDEEFPALALRASEEKLTKQQIKAAIKNWRSDYSRL
jgi:hypothetical protein